MKGKMLGEANSKRIRLVQTGKKKQPHMRASSFRGDSGKKKKKVPNLATISLYCSTAYKSDRMLDDHIDPKT